MTNGECVSYDNNLNDKQKPMAGLEHFKGRCRGLSTVFSIVAPYK